MFWFLWLCGKTFVSFIIIFHSVGWVDFTINNLHISDLQKCSYSIRYMQTNLSMLKFSNNIINYNPYPLMQGNTYNICSSLGRQFLVQTSLQQKTISFVVNSAMSDARRLYYEQGKCIRLKQAQLITMHSQDLQTKGWFSSIDGMSFWDCYQPFPGV